MIITQKVVRCQGTSNGGRRRLHFDTVIIVKVTGQLSCSACLSLLLFLIIGSVSLAQIMYHSDYIRKNF